MTYVPHVRMSMIGRLGGSGGAEIFSMSIALSENAGGSGVWDGGGLGPNDDVWEDLADDCAAWFARPLTGIHADAVLQLVKFAAIGADGKYTSAAIEKPRVVAGGQANLQRPHNQSARVVTLNTAGDLNRIKGRFYVPLPAFGVQPDGRWLAEDADAMEGSDKTFIDAINNQPGLDVLDIGVVVASQGRRDQFGALRVQPGNHPVTSISVGRTPDTQRRRRNRLTEGRTSVAVS